MDTKKEREEAAKAEKDNAKHEEEYSHLTADERQAREHEDKWRREFEQKEDE